MKKEGVGVSSKVVGKRTQIKLISVPCYASDGADGESNAE